MRLSAKLKRRHSLNILHGAGIVLFSGVFAWQVSAQQDPEQRNIVAIGGSVTEIVFALDQQHRLIARDTTSLYPPEVLDLPDVGYVRALSPEGVLSVGPELVIAEEGAGPAEAVNVLRKSSVPYVTVPEVDSPAGVIDKIRVVGAALGVDEQAEALARETQTNFEEVIAAVQAQDADKRRVMFILSTQGNRVMASGVNTAADAIINLAGGENVIQTFEGYKPVTEEAILAAQPDVILMMARRGNHSSTNEQLWSMAALAETPAAKTEAVVRIDGLLLLGFGPRTPEAIETLYQALYEAS
ncbi:MAG: ABC transporter substrate-binding protein [Pseudomonadota bacterium]